MQEWFTTFKLPETKQVACTFNYELADPEAPITDNPFLRTCNITKLAEMTNAILDNVKLNFKTSTANANSL
jgi:hypothetical protein